MSQDLRDPVKLGPWMQRWALRVLQFLKPGGYQKLLLEATLVGVLGAFAALAFKYAGMAIEFVFTGHREGLVDAFRDLSAWQRFWIPVAGGLISGVLLLFTERLQPRKATDYMEAIALGNGDLPVRASLMRAFASLFSISTGAAIGREGPLVQLAAVQASLFGRIRRGSPARRRLLVACGSAAGIAAAYNTPIAGAFFVAEIILGSIAMESLGPLLLASFVSAMTIRVVTPGEVLFPLELPFVLGLEDLPLFMLLGVGCGLAAPAFIAFLSQAKRGFARLPFPLPLRMAIGAAVFGLIASRIPEVAGNGGTVIREMMQGGLTRDHVILILICKVVAVAAVFGSGAIGGVFTPSLLIGASLGFLLGAAGQAMGYPAADPAVCAVVGMGGLLGAATQAPLMAILMVFEMTRHPDLIMPLMATAVTAQVVARSVGGRALYAESLKSGPRSVFDRPMGELTVREVLRSGFSVLSPVSRFSEVARRFLSAQESLLPVVDAGRVLKGIVLLEDVEPYLKDPHLAEVLIARDLLREGFPSLRADQGLFDAMKAFTATSHNVLPVCDDAGLLVGMLERNDLFMLVAELARRQPL
jgi:CIC family chloride channel protein